MMDRAYVEQLRQCLANGTPIQGPAEFNIQYIASREQEHAQALREAEEQAQKTNEERRMRGEEPLPRRPPGYGAIPRFSH